MKRSISAWILGAAVLLTFGSSVSVAQGGGPAPGDDVMVEWLDDYAQALAEAKRTGKPIFLEFRCAP